MEGMVFFRGDFSLFVLKAEAAAAAIHPSLASAEKTAELVVVSSVARLLHFIPIPV